jgi:hypothetical protein
MDTITMKDLGSWESLETVQCYTRSVTFEDSLKSRQRPAGMMEEASGAKTSQMPLVTILG